MQENFDPVVRMLAGYEPMIRRFVCGNTSASEFESEFVPYFKNDQFQVIGEAFDVLDGLFADVDAFEADPGLRQSTGGMGADELRLRARSAFAKLYGREIQC